MADFGTEAGAVCWRDGCDGVIVERPVEKCSCHLSPPCSGHSEPREWCPECEWTAADERRAEQRRADAIHIAPGIGAKWSEPRPLDPRKIDWRDRPHSGSSMIKEGIYPDGTTAKQVLDTIGRGTFGGRFEQFGGGRFRYIAYTD